MPSKVSQSTELHPLDDIATRNRGTLRGVIAGLLLVAVTVVAYTPVYDAGFIWDDDDYVYENPLLPASDGLARIWTTRESPQYYPLVFTTFWIEYRLWGLDPSGYHLVNVLLHAINALLIWLLLRRIGFGPAYIVAALFALHPVHVESVAWITERKNVLSVLCYLLSMGSYLRFEESGRRRWYAAAFLLFALGLFAKTVICTLPLALLLLRWLRRAPITARALTPLIPFIVLGATMGSVTAWYEHYNVLHGAHGAHWGLSIQERVIVAGRALCFYTAKLLWPSPLVFNYPRWNIDATNLLQWLWPLAAVLTAGGLWGLRHRLGRGLTVAAWFTAITVSPALGFVNVAPMRFSFVADHFQYLSSLGVLAAVVGIAGALISRAFGVLGGGFRVLEAPARLRGVRIVAGALTIVGITALGVLTYRQALLYRDVEGLWRHTIEHNPGSWLARGNLGVLLRERGRLGQAKEQFDYVLAHCDPEPEPRAQAHTNIGHIHRTRGEFEEAVRHYRRALAAMVNKHEARFGLAATYNALGASARAVKEHRRYLSDNPDDARAHFNLALTLEAQQRLGEAERHYLQALSCDAHLAAPHVKLAQLYARQGKNDKTADHYHAALRVDPGAAEIRIAFADFLTRSGRKGEAGELLQTGLRLDPRSDQLKSAVAALRETASKSAPD